MISLILAFNATDKPLNGIFHASLFQRTVFRSAAGWMLIPDKLDDEGDKPARYGVFLTTLVAFFLVEMGDKTQIATVAVAAHYSSLIAVVVGTTLGMMIANVPAVLLGEVAAKKLPMRVVHGVVAVIFVVLGVVILLG